MLTCYAKSGIFFSNSGHLMEKYLSYEVYLSYFQFLNYKGVCMTVYISQGDEVYKLWSLETFMF